MAMVMMAGDNINDRDDLMIIQKTMMIDDNENDENEKKNEINDDEKLRTTIKK